MTHTVLIIDDDKIPMQYYERALRRRHFAVESCSDVDAALRRLNNRAAPPDLIVLDVMMPPGETFTMEETEEGVITGVLLYKHIRERLPDIPIIVLTNSQNPELDRQFAGLSQTRVLRKKDFPPFTLATEVGHMISKKS